MYKPYGSFCLNQLSISKELWFIIFGPTHKENAILQHNIKAIFTIQKMLCAHEKQENERETFTCTY